MTVHEQILIIQEFKHLYSEEEYNVILNEWRKNYIKYLVKLADDHPNIDDFM